MKPVAGNRGVTKGKIRILYARAGFSGMPAGRTIQEAPVLIPSP